MLKEYVTKRLPFFQSGGKHAKKRDERPAEPPEQVQPPLEEELPEDMASLFEDRAEKAQPPAEIPPAELPAADPAPSAEEPAEAVYAAGMDAYQAKEYPRAFDLFTRAAEQGHPRAQFLCGRMAQMGFAAESGDKPALAWYKRAAKQGSAEAQMACAEMYEQGSGTAMNLKQALFWYEQAAKQGNLRAQVKCGYMYFCGRAETRSPRKARRWLEAAAGNGSAEAKKLLEERF